MALGILAWRGVLAGAALLVGVAAWGGCTRTRPASVATGAFSPGGAEGGRTAGGSHRVQARFDHAAGDCVYHVNLQGTLGRPWTRAPGAVFDAAVDLQAILYCPSGTTTVQEGRVEGRLTAGDLERALEAAGVLTSRDGDAHCTYLPDFALGERSPVGHDVVRACPLPEATPVPASPAVVRVSQTFVRDLPERCVYRATLSGAPGPTARGATTTRPLLLHAPALDVTAEVICPGVAPAHAVGARVPVAGADPAALANALEAATRVTLRARGRVCTYHAEYELAHGRVAARDVASRCATAVAAR